MEYCPHCIRVTDQPQCTHCGGTVRWEAKPGQLSVGTVLQGTEGREYQVGAAKGQGGFGITYAAMCLTDGRRVAIKEYYPSRCASRQFTHQVAPMTGMEQEFRTGKQTFYEEAMMLSAVGALPSVVTVYDCFETNGTAYLVMEYVDGAPLNAIVAQKGPMTATELLPMLPALLDDLAVLHQAGIIHRDISPDNLLLTPEGKLKLIDFGSARSLNSSKNMTVLLKPGFSPVEQYQSKGQGPYTDLYALAGTIYYCLTGTIPPAAFDRVAADTLQRPNTLGAGLTQQQENVLMWALAIQPERRPATATLFSERLFFQPKPPPVIPSEKPIPPTVTETATETVEESIPDAAPRKKRHILRYVVAGVLALSVIGNILLSIATFYYADEASRADTYYHRYLEMSDSKNDYDQLNNKYAQILDKYAQIKDEYDFYNVYACIVPDDGSNLYHKHGCSQLDTTNGFWIYNINSAKGKDFTPCPVCFADD